MKYALIIGNDNYTDPKLAHLKTPEADTRALAGVLSDANLGKFDQVIPLINQTETETRRAISSFLANKKPDDLVLVYFSGHGVLDSRGRLFLALQDTQTSILTATAIPSSFIADEMDNCRSKRQILILDCCHSGAFERGTKGGDQKAVTEATFEGTGFGRVVLTASDSTQYALEGDQVIEQTDLSLFTHFLLEGIKTGEADMNNDGLVTLDEWYDYTYTKVISETPRQVPNKWSYRQQGDLVISNNPHAKKKTAEFPVQLVQALESPLASIREGAVKELGRLLHSSNPEMTALARSTLEKIRKEDDSRSVAILAWQVLSEYQAAAEKRTPPVATGKSSGAGASTATIHEIRKSIEVSMPLSEPKENRSNLEVSMPVSEPKGNINNIEVSAPVLEPRENRSNIEISTPVSAPRRTASKVSLRWILGGIAVTGCLCVVLAAAVGLPRLVTLLKPAPVQAPSYLPTEVSQAAVAPTAASSSAPVLVPTEAPPAATPAPVPTPAPTAAPAAPNGAGASVYDDFNNPAFDQSIDPDRWKIIRASSNGSGTQEQGKLILIQSASQDGTILTANALVASPTYVEIQWEMNQGTADGDLAVSITGDTSVVGCLMENNGRITEFCHFIDSKKNKKINISATGASFNHTYTLGIGIDYSSRIATIYLDGMELGTYEFLPDESMNFDSVELSLWSVSDGTITSSLDNLRIKY